MIEQESKADLKSQVVSQQSASPVSIWGAMMAVYIAWGSTYLAIRFAVETMPPFLMAATRFLIAGSILYFWRRFRRDARPAGFEWRSAAIIGTLMLVGGNGGVVWAEQRVPSGIAALLVASAPLWMVLIDALRPFGQTRKRPGGLTLLGVVVGFLGLILLISPSRFIGMGEEVDLIGAAVLTMAAFFWSLGSIYNRGARLPSSPLLGTGMEMLAGGFGLLILGTLSGEWSRLNLEAITPRSIFSLAYLIVFGSLIGFAAYTWLLRSAPTPLVSTYAYVNPLVAIFVGNLLAGEPLTLRVLVATVVIIGGVALISVTQPLSRGSKDVDSLAPSTGED